MSITQDYALIVSTQLTHLDRSLRNGVPTGVPAQLAEVSTTLATYDGQLAKLKADDGLSQAGLARQIRTAYDKAQTAVEQWRVGKTSGIDKQLSSQRAALLTDADKALPVPTDLQVTNMVQCLSDFDPLEVEMLYANATDAERRIVEAAASAIGRQPVRRGDKLVWEPLIATERMTEAIAARAERANPEGAAQLRSLQEIRNTYEAVAGAAKGLLHASFPAHHEPASVA
jgi:hypothetical protein